MIDSRLNQEIGRELENYNRSNNRQIFLAAGILLLISIGIFFLNPGITSLAVFEKQLNYSDNINAEFNGNSEYIWIPEHVGLIKSLKLSGSYKTEGNVKVYLEDEDVRYLIFDSNKSSESGLTGITGLAILNESNNNSIINESNENNNTATNETIENNNSINNETDISTINDTLAINETLIENETIEINETPIINETAEINKTIIINLDYKTDTPYDTDNDGIEDIYGVVDLTVENTNFNWDVNKENLCARYEIYSVENKESTIVCYGSSKCCSLVELMPTRPQWNESFYSSYGAYGASSNNIISAQVLYVDYNLSVIEPFAEIYYSDWQGLPVRFNDLFTSFENICIETCILLLNKTSYKLIIEIDNTTLRLDAIDYIIQIEEEINNPPVLIKDIPNQTLILDNLTINLSEYFEDIDNDPLVYNYYKVDDIAVNIENSIATITPGESFAGTVYTYFTANDSYETAVSNVFSIDITNISIEKLKEQISKSRVVINKPVKWLKQIKLDKLETNVTINISSFAENITVKKITEDISEIIPEEKIKIKEKGKIKDLKEYNTEKEIEKLEKEKITGAVTLITGNIILENTSSGSLENSTEIIIEDLVEEIEIEYFTEGPASEEIEISNNKKQIIISSGIHYEDILAYTNLPIEAASEAVKLYWLVNNTRIEVNIDKFDTNQNNLIDYIEWTVPSLSNQSYELEITILNIQSYPTVGGNWTVRFNTTGTGNLTITASNETTYSELYNDNIATIDDLTTIELRCNNNILFNKNDLINNENIYLISNNHQKLRLNDTINNNIEIKSLYVENYNCSGLGYWTVKVLTPGVHTQKFNFSNQIAYANNFAFVQANISGFDQGNYTNTTSNATGVYLITGGEIGRANQSSHVVNTSGLVLLMHFNNESAYGENATGNSADVVYDFSPDVNSERSGSIRNNGTTKNGAIINKTDYKLGSGSAGFDVTDDYIDVGSDTSLDNTFDGGGTHISWIKPNGEGEGTVGMIFTDGGLVVQFANFGEVAGKTGAYFVHLFGGDNGVWQSTSKVFTNDEWSFYAVTYNADSVDNNPTFYIGTGGDLTTLTVGSGITEATTPTGTRTDGSAQSKYIGGNAGANTFDGIIDELSIYNRSLSAKEIKELYFMGLNATRGTYTSKVFDAGTNASWVNISWEEEVPYQEEIGRAVGDGNTAADEDGFTNTSGLVLLYHFNNESALGENATGGSADVVHDFSPDVNSERTGSVRNNGTTGGGATINKTDYKLGGGAAEFYGSDDAVILPANFMPSSGTIEMWLKYDLAKYHYIFSSDLNEISIYNAPTYTALYYDGALRIQVYNAIINNTWNHMVYTFARNADAYLYINGVEVGSGAIPDVAVTNAATRLGLGTDGNLDFTGTIDELSIWNRSLSPKEILDHYKRGALRLNVSVRSCDDDQCSGETFSEDFENATQSNFTLAQNRYFQYKFNFETELNGNYTQNTPMLYNVTINLHNITFLLNTALNKSLDSIYQYDVINITANITYLEGLSFCQIIINQSGFNEIVNISLGGATSAQCSNKSQVTVSAGNVINFTIRVNDTLDNWYTNDNIITVADENCDEGFTTTECNITTSRTIAANSVINYTKLRIKNGGILTADATNIFTINSSVITIEDGGSITGNANITAANLTIKTGGSINVTGKGYASATGPGQGTDGGNSNGAGGAGHGASGGDGESGNAGGSAYGSITEPVIQGSGGGGWSETTGGGAGAGSIFLNITDTLNVTGDITSNGGEGQTAATAFAAGGGSGGSIYIITSNFTGNGSITANGGNGGDNDNADGGGGAGGRIAIYYTDKTYTGSILANGATGPDSAGEAGAGTIFQKSDSQTNGDLIINNNGVSGTSTPLNGSYKSTFDSINLTGSAILLIENANITTPTFFPITSSATLALQRDYNLTISSNLTLDTGRLTITNATFSIGNITVQSSSIITLTNSTLNITSGNLTLDSSTLTITNTLFSIRNLIALSSSTITNNGNLNTTGLYLQTSSTITNNGNITINTTYLAEGTTTITNNANGLMLFPLLPSSTLNINNTFVNYGNISGTDGKIESIVLKSGGDLSLSQYLNLSAITIESGGILSHTANGYALNIAAINLTIETGGLINVNEKGYASSTGPGQGTDGGNSNGAGGAGYGAHGGDGQTGYAGGSAYGSITEPVIQGSGGGGWSETTGGGAGAGSIFLNITDTLNVTGDITSNGGEGQTAATAFAAGGGSGGSIYLIASNFTGNGSITANGGNGGDNTNADGGGGAGGRIAIYYTTKNYSGSITAGGGTGPDSATDGGTGTVLEVENLTSITEEVDITTVSEGSSIKVNGTIIVNNISLNGITWANVSIFLEDSTIPNVTSDSVFNYNYTFTAPSGIGTHTVNVSFGIAENTASFTVDALNLTINTTPETANVDTINVTINVTIDSEAGRTVGSIKNITATIIKPDGTTEIVPNESFSCFGTNYTLDLQVGVSTDDAGSQAGSWSLVNDYLVLGGCTSSPDNQGIRFASVNIPSGISIDTAYLTIYGYSGYDCGGTADVDIYGDDEDNCDTFSTEADFDGRSRTSAKVDWDDIQVVNGWRNSPEIKTIIQEIIDRANWQSGNALAIILDGQTVYAGRSAYTIDGYPGGIRRPKLHIEYIASPFNCTATWSNTSTQIGYHNVTVTATDNEDINGTNTSSNDFLVIDTTPPIINSSFNISNFIPTDGTVNTFSKISDTEGNFTGRLDNSDYFGNSIANIGDLDGNGVEDLAVGAYLDDDGVGGASSNTGAVYILFMASNGSVNSHYKLNESNINSSSEKNISLDNLDYFGSSVANIGDLDGDSVTDLAVGAYSDDDGDTDRGAVYILFMQSNGSVKNLSKISDTEGNFTGTLGNTDYFGYSIANIGDLDGNGVTDLAVGASYDDDGEDANNEGAVYILFMASNGSVNSFSKISDTEGNFTGTLDGNDRFGNSIANIGDLDGNGVTDLAIGAYLDDDGAASGNRGAVWLLFMASNGSVNSFSKISDTEGSFTGTLDDSDNFGYSVASIGDLDGDGVTDLAVGARGDNGDGGSSRGAVYILFMKSNGSVNSHQKISDTEGNFNGILDNSDNFGTSVVDIGDPDGNGITNLAVGAYLDGDGGSPRGAVWLLNLKSTATAPRINDIINASFNLSDNAALSLVNITINISGTPALNFTYSVSGTSAQASQNITINLTRGNVINITGYAIDTSGNIKQNSTLFTVANTPPNAPTIVFPTSNLYTSSQPLDLNVTATDADNDALTINYYINSLLNDSTSTNTTFNASEGYYTLNVSAYDGFAYSANTSVNFTLDPTPPTVNATLSKLITSVMIGGTINLTANATDGIGLSTGSIIVNDTGINRYFNFSLSGTTGTFTQNITITCPLCTINFTAWVNDTSGNIAINDTIVTFISMNISINLNTTRVNTTDPIAVSGHINLSNGTNVSNTRINMFIDGTRTYANETGSIIIENATDFASGTAINITINANNIALNKDESNQYPNQTGNFTSQVIDTGSVNSNFAFISWTEEVPYQTEIGRAAGDGNSASDEDSFINTSGLVLLMHFNNESALGEATETTSNGDNYSLDFSVDVNSERSGEDRNNGSFYNGATINKTDYKFGGGAAEFDGTDDYVDLGEPSFASDQSGSFAMWVNVKTYGGDKTFFSFSDPSGASNEWFITEATNGALQIVVIVGGGYSLSAVTTGGLWELGEWWHLAVTSDGSTLKLYVDGVLKSLPISLGSNSGQWWGDVTGGADSFTAGGLRRSGALANDFIGKIDEVAIWNRSLSVAEILKHYKRGALSLNLSVRSCDDSSCSGESFSETLTNASGIKLNTSITPINRYFQYKAVLNTEDVDYTPVLYNITINYTALATDSKGNYNYTLTPPSSLGNHTLKVNTTFYSIYGENSVNFTVVDEVFPTLTAALNKSLKIIYTNDIINITANLTDNLGLSFCQIIINQSGFNEIVNISLGGATSAECSNSSKVTLASGGVINYTIRVNDTGNNWVTDDTIITVIANLNFSILVNKTGIRTKFGFDNVVFNQTFVNTGTDAIELENNFYNGTLRSEIFDLGASYEFQNISWTQEVPYQEEIGRAVGDGNSATDEDGFINTSGLVLLMHFNNESAYGEATETTSAGDNYSLDFSVDVNSDRSGSARNNGSFYNGATINKTDYKLGGGAAEFDGDNDIVVISSPNGIPIGSTDRTFTLWAKTTDIASTLTLFSYGSYTNPGYYFFFRHINGVFQLGTFTCNAFNLNVGMTADTWHFIALSVTNGDLVSLWVDQTLATETMSCAIDTQETDFEIGVDKRTPEGYWNGTIDEVAIWNRSLSAKEIQDIYKRGAARLNISLRSCDDAACDTETFDVNASNATSSDISSLSDNRYIQYRANFYTDYLNTSPQLYNVTIHYGDYTLPVVNATLNKSTTGIRGFEVVNITANVTDNFDLSFGQIIVNDTGFVRYFNFSLSGTSAQFSQNITITDENAVINFTARVNDSSNNFRTNDTIVSVVHIANLTININDTIVNTTDPIAVSGHINLSNGTNVSNTQIAIWMDGQLSGCGDGHTANSDGTCTATFYPDAHPETTSVDGMVGHDGSGDHTWTDLRGQSGNWHADESAMYYAFAVASHSTTDRWTQLWRSIFLFDTSSLPDNTDISAAILSLYGPGKAAAHQKFDYAIYSSNPASNIDLVPSDFETLGSTAFSQTILYDDVDDAGYNDFILNDNGIAAISKTGVSKFGTRDVTYDVGGAEPSWVGAGWSGNLYTYYSEQGEGYKPKLVVTYTPPLTTNSTGHYNYTFMPPTSLGNHTIKVNTTFDGIYGENIINFTVVDPIPPTITATLNKSFTNITINDVINITANITDNINLSFCQIIINQSGPTALEIINISLAAPTAQCSNSSPVTLIRGNVINYTIRVNDTSNNWRTNDTIITVANTPPRGFSIVHPANNDYTTEQPLGLNVTFATDPDGDTTTINYYINGKLNSSTTTNITFNASDGNYILNISITDSVDHHDNLSINFTIDTTNPIVNASLNKSLTNITINDVINLTANATDNLGLSFGQIIVNDTGIKRYFNFSLDDTTTATFSQNITISAIRGNVINFTARVNDTSNTFKTNDTIITVANTPPTGLNITFPTPNQNTSNRNLNVTFRKDPDGDTTTINYYINGKLNDSTLFNTTFNASDGNYLLNISITDSVEQHTNITVNFTLDTTPPNVTFKSPTPANNTAGGQQVTFNWTASDNIDASITCYPIIDGTLYASNQTQNSSHSNTTITLTGGNHSIKVTCFDDANNSNSTEERIYTVGIINITLPSHDEIIRPSEKFRFNISVLAGSDWVNNITLVIFNETFYTENFSSTLYNFTYTVINVTPRYINATAYGFNNESGPGTNISSQIQLRIGRLGTTEAPTISYVCPNESYTLNSTTIAMETIADLDTLVESYNVTVILPDQQTAQPVQLVNTTDTNYSANFNYTYLTSLEGNYKIVTRVEDIENQSFTLNRTLTVSNSTKDINLTKIGLTNLTFKDVCTGKILFYDDATIPNVSYYDADSIVTSAISLAFKNITLNSTINNTLNFTQLTNEVDAPTGKRRVDLWDLLTNMIFKNATLYYNYSSIEHTLTHESNLDIYQCNNISNCILEKRNSILNLTNNIVISITNLSRFMLTEPALGAIPSQLAAPAISYINLSRTYTKTDETVNITVVFNISFELDTVILTVNATQLTAINITNVGQNYKYIYNYSPATLGPYLVHVNIEDENTFNSNQSIWLYAVEEQSMNLEAKGVNNMTLRDVTNKEGIVSGDNISITLPEGKYNIFIEGNKTDITIINASINNSVSTVLEFQDLAETITAPGNRTNLDQFEVNASVGFASIDIVYDYTNLTASISDEDNLEVYKCANSSNCNWTEIPSTVDAAANTLSFTVYNLSVFDIVESIKIVTETETLTNTVTVTTSSGGGGGGGGGSVVTKIASLNLILPPTISMRLQDRVTIPILLKNIGDVTLNSINLSYEIEAEGITIDIKDISFETLGIDETLSTSAVITTNLEKPGKDKITITAKANDPKLEDSAEIVIDTTDVYKGNITIVEGEIKFALNLFEQNPECLELKELLTQAQTALEKQEFQKALALTASAIDACKQLVGEKGLRPVVARSSKFRLEATWPLIILALIIILALMIYGAKKIPWGMPKFSLGLKLPKGKHRHRKIGPTKKELGTYENEEKEIRKMLRGV